MVKMGFHRSLLCVAGRESAYRLDECQSGSARGCPRLSLAGPRQTACRCGSPRAPLAGALELDEHLGRNREAETRGGRVGEQRVYSRTAWEMSGRVRMAKAR